MSQKKNILLLINQLYGGGAQKVIATLSQELAKQYNIIFVIYNDLDKIVFPFEGELVKIKLPYYQNTSANAAYARFIRFIVLIYRLRRIKKAYKIDVSISFLEASNIVNVLSKRSEKLILSVRSYLSNEFKDDPRIKVFKGFIRKLYNKANYIVAPSQMIKNDLIQNFNVKDNRTRVIYNFIDKDFLMLSKEQPVNNTDLNSLFRFPVLINVGRLTNPKGQWFLVPILKEVKKNVPNVKLLILGEGPLKDRILQIAHVSGFRCYEGPESFSKYDVHNIEDFDIFLPGFQPNIYPFLWRSTAFVFTSVYEGFPNVLIEAMACGLPVISSDCTSGPREILAPATDIQKVTNVAEYAEYGVLIPVLNESDSKYQQNIKLWSETITQLLTQPEVNTKLREQSTIRSADYAKGVILKDWIDVIEN